jgi:hypothetical protein
MSNQRLNATISIGGTVDRSLTKGLTDTKGQLAEVGGAIRAAERRQRDLSRQIRTFGEQGRSVDGLRRKYADLSVEIDRLRRRQRALQDLAAANVGGRFRTMTSEVGRLARRTAMLGSAAAGGIFAVANSTSSLGDNIAKTADKLGIGTTALQELRYAAERSGVGAGTLDTAMQRMVRRVSEAAQGTGAAKGAIDELGLSAAALASMAPDEQLNHIADAMANVENQGDRVRLAMKLFDTEGVSMVNMLKDGALGLEELGLEAHRTGYILSEQATRDAEEFQDRLLDTRLSLAGLKNIIGSELMPVVADMMGQFTGWLAENRDQVREWSAMFADRLRAAVPVIGDLASGIGTVVTTVGNAVNGTAQLVGGFDNLAMIVGGLFAAKAVVAVGAFAVSIGRAGAALVSLAGSLPVVAGGIKAIGAALLATPIGWVVGGLAAIAGAAYLIYSNWEAIGPWFGRLWDGVKNVASAAWEGIKAVVAWSPLGLLARAWSGLSERIGSPIEAARNVASSAWEGIKAVVAWSPLGLIARGWSALSDRVGGFSNAARAGVSVAWEGIKAVVAWSPLGLLVRSWGPGIERIGALVEGAKEMVGAVWSWFSERLSWSPLAAVDGAWGGLTDWFGGMWDGITGAAERALDWITGKLEWVGNAFNRVRGWISWGDDDESADEARAQLGGGNAGALGLTSNRERRQAESEAAVQSRVPRQAPPPPALSGGSSAAERVREVVNNITNNLTLHVTRREGEGDASYAQRIADMVLEELNARQQGALYDG